MQLTALWMASRLVQFRSRAGLLPLNAFRNASTISRCRFHGIPVFSHRPHVPLSTPNCCAASLTVHPIARRAKTSRSERLIGIGQGSKPKNLIMAGMDSTAGSLFPFSQLKTVRQLVPSRSAAAFWLSPSSRRRLRICSPKVRGSKSGSFGFRALSVTGTDGKKATRP